jgi:hypothetical protein
MAVVLRSDGGPFVVLAGLGGARQALPPRSRTRSAGRRPAEVLHGPWNEPGDRAGTRPDGGLAALGVALRQANTIIDDLMSQLLTTERVVNDAQILAQYSKVLIEIREAKELERLQDFLTPGGMEMLLEILPKKEVSYWRWEQSGVEAKNMAVAFYLFVRRRAQELGSNANAAKIAQTCSGLGFGRSLRTGGSLWREPHA